MTPSVHELTGQITGAAFGLGFDLVGVAPLDPPETAPAFDEWIAKGMHGAMAYMERGAARRRNPRSAVPGTTHAVVVGASYGDSGPGRVARYARGTDYHDVLLDRLTRLHGELERIAGHPVAGKAYVDTGPILERDLARRAGLGWFGKNTMLIHPRLGSYFLLGVLVVDQELEPSAPFRTDHCGTCTRCLEACPTRAFTAPHVLDARRCISYLTIEFRGEISADLEPLMGEHLFGCDICQEVCPWNGKFARAGEIGAIRSHPEFATLEPSDVLAMDDADFRARFRGTPLTRPKLAGMARNARIALRNRSGSPSDP